MTVVAIVQARMGSTRLPGKVLLPIGARPLMEHVVRRLRAASTIDVVVVATSELPRDEPVRAFCTHHDVPVFAGDETDVLDRFYRAARALEADTIVRITADCPLVDPAVVDALVSLFADGDFDHVGVATGAVAATTGYRRYPDGLDAECLSFSALEQAWQEATEPYDREHVTPYLYAVPGRFRNGVLEAPVDLGEHRWTVDTPADLELVRAIYAALDDGDRIFSSDDVLAFLGANAELVELDSALAGHA